MSKRFEEIKEWFYADHEFFSEDDVPNYELFNKIGHGVVYLISRVERLETGLNLIKTQASSSQPTLKDKLYYDIADGALADDEEGK